MVNAQLIEKVLAEVRAKIIALIVCEWLLTDRSQS